MLKVKVYNTIGEVVGNKELNPKVFDIDLKPEVIHRVIETQLANRRKPWAATRDRGAVAGGGKKPWKQKGTGRARVSSIRSPLWRGGGIVFGPNKERNFAKKINKKEKRKALFMVLTEKVKSNHLVLVDKIILNKIKTKDFVNMLSKLPCGRDKKTIVLYDKSDLKLIKSSRNIENLKTIKADSLNVFDILKHDWLLMPEQALEVIEKVYLK